MTPRRLACAGLLLLLVGLVPWSARRAAGGPRVVLDHPAPTAPPRQTGGGEEHAAPAEERALPPELAGPAPISDRTSIVVLQLGAGAELLSWAEKPVRYLPPDLPADARATYRLEDARTGALLHEGPCDLPTPCRCEIGRDHADGCAVLRHDPVVRLKLPRLAERERVTLVSSGKTVGSFLLEAN